MLTFYYTLNVLLELLLSFSFLYQTTKTKFQDYCIPMFHSLFVVSKEKALSTDLTIFKMYGYNGFNFSNFHTNHKNLT